MELRLLVSESEKRTFVEKMEEARRVRNGGFRESPRSCVSHIHVEFGRMYGLFDDSALRPDGMLAGVIFHDLGSFAQSYPKPDFSHYPPERVHEAGELWALVKGAGKILLRGGVILLGLLQAQAAVGYAVVKPWDLSGFYKEFLPKGEAVEWPYVQTLDGGKIFCRAMVTEGEHLTRMVEKEWSAGFETYDRHRRIRFPENAAELPVDEELVAMSRSAGGEEVNGAAHL